MTWQDELMDYGLIDDYDDLLGMDFGFDDMSYMSYMDDADMYAGGTGADYSADSSMDYMMGGMGGGVAAAGAMNSPRANPKGGLAGLTAMSLGKFAMPGTPQVMPDRDNTQKPNDPNKIPLRGRQGGTVRNLNEPAGATQKAGNLVKNGYANLNRLRNRALGSNRQMNRANRPRNRESSLNGLRNRAYS